MHARGTGGVLAPLWLAAGSIVPLAAPWVLCPTAAGAQTTPTAYGVHAVTDTLLLATSLVTAVGSQLTIDSGELQARRPGPIANIPFYDRWVAERAQSESADPLSNVGMGLALAYGLFDSVRAGAREGSEAGFVSSVLYLESALVNWSLLNIIKLSVRRPRPIAYATGQSPVDTNRELSFYSGHTAITAGMAGTAGYLIAAREGPSAATWSVLLVGTAMTAFVGINRLRANKHFPSDVVIGAVVGACVGILVPHLHRRDGGEQATTAARGDAPLAASFSFRF